STDSVADAYGSLRPYIVLPNSHDRPTCVSQTPIGIPIPRLVASDLLLPERAILRRGAIVLLTPVPVAAVNEYRDASSRKHHVSGSPNTRNGPSGHPIPQAELVHQRPKSPLGTRVTGGVRLHDAADWLAACP